MFNCTECGYKAVKWVGKCPKCNTWESLLEEKDISIKDDPLEFLDKSGPVLIKDIKEEKHLRTLIGIDELDRVLGGGLVKGEVVLVGGEPGIGKSTLFLQVAAALSKKAKCLYVSGEESSQQINLRAKRLAQNFDSLYILNEDNLDEVYRYVNEYKIEFLIIDSIQAVFSPRIDSGRGTPNQIRGCAEFLNRLAKTSGITVIIIGHVTKEGIIAGPKLLEHIVDCVLYFEPENSSNFRIVRASKNRFGSTGEVAIFEMTSSGLNEVKSLPDIFLPHKDQPIAGSCVGCVIEGVKPILIELQALASKSNFGMVRRRTSGFDFNRFAILIAIIEKRLKISLASQDIFLNVAGGIRITDPSADLAAAISIISSLWEEELEAKIVFIGEVGLGGELRPVSNIISRLKEVARGGFKKCFIPKGNFREIKQDFKSFEILGVDSLKEVLELTKNSRNIKNNGVAHSNS